MNDIKEKEQLPIVPLATLLLSRESGRTDGRKNRRADGVFSISPGANLAEDNKSLRQIVNKVYKIAMKIPMVCCS
jgi:hypothetical protein